MKKVGLLLFIIFMSVSYGQQVIGSFPVMDGGFENQTGTLGTSLSGSAWSRQSGNTSTISNTGGRSGPKYVTANVAATVRLLQTPQDATAAKGPAANTAYRVQFYYRLSTAFNVFQIGVSTNGTTNPTYSTGVTLASTGSVWTKYEGTVTTPSNTPTTAGIGIIRGGTSATGGPIDVDDFVIYAGAIDNTAPNAPTSPSVTVASATSLTVSWTAPAAGVDGGGYIVVRGTADPSTAPNANGIYAVGNTVTTGQTVVYIGTGTSFTDGSLTTGTPYYYRIYTVDKAFNYSTALTANGTPISSGTPSIALNSASPAGTSINQNSTNNILYSIKADVTTADATLNSVQVNTAGTYQTTDIQTNGFRFWINTSNSVSGATQLGSDLAVVASGGNLSVTGLSNILSKTSSTYYILVTANVNYNAVNGHTLSIASTVLANIVFASGSVSGTSDPIAAGNSMNILAVTPNIAINNTNAVTAGNFATGTSNVQLIQISIAPTDNSTDLTSLTVTTSGTYLSSDIVTNGFKLYYNSTNSFPGSSIATIAVVASGGNLVFNGFTQKIEANTTGYIWITADLSATSGSNRTISLQSTAYTNILFSQGSITGAGPVDPGVVQTLISTATPVAGNILINQISTAYSGASDEYIELVNVTSNAYDLSALKIVYQSSTGGSGGAGGTLSGTLAPYSFWLLSPNATVTVGLTTSLTRDGSFTSGLAAASGQLALETTGGTIIDGLAYGSISGGTLGEGSPASSPPTIGGLKRVTDGADNNTNSSDFTTVANANIDLRNSSSRILPLNAVLGPGTYTRISVTGNSSISGNINVGSVNFNGPALLKLGANKLTVSNSITGASSTSYIVTDGSGLLVQTGTSLLFPIGASIDGSTNSYNPITLTNTTSKKFSVRVFPLIDNSYGTKDYTDCVQRLWGVTCESNTGVSLTVNLQWNASNEGSKFTSKRSGEIMGVHSSIKLGFDVISAVNKNVTTEPYNISNINSLVPNVDNFDMTSERLYGIGDGGVAGALPVELSSFVSNANGRVISLNWETKTEKNSNKFEIERSLSTESKWEVIGSVKAADLSNSPKDYSFVDKNLQAGKFQYRLKMIDNDGTFEYSKVTETEITLPKNFELNQNYPNPFNPSTKISYSLPFDSKVTLDVYNIIGEKVAQLVSQEQPAGYYSVDFSNSSINKSLSSGVYLYRINAIDKSTGKDFSSIKKMVLMK